jgi:hypothetical protein
MLGLIDGVQVQTRPTVVRLPTTPTPELTVDLRRGAGYPDPATARRVDEVGVEIALEYLGRRHPGCEVVEMPHENPGFDAKVLDVDGVVVKYGEIKSTLGDAPTFFMSENERQFAETHAEEYELIVVSAIDLEGRTGVVQLHAGSLIADAIALTPRQWKGVLLPPT